MVKPFHAPEETFIENNFDIFVSSDLIYYTYTHVTFKYGDFVMLYICPKALY